MGEGLAHLVQYHVTDWWEPLRLLNAGRHELEAEQVVPVVLSLPAALRQVWTRETGDQRPGDQRPGDHRSGDKKTGVGERRT